MRILALVPYLFDTAPGQRYRIEQWAPHLQQMGVEISYAPFESPTLHRIKGQSGHTARKAQHVARGALRRFGTLWRASHFDAIYIYREAVPLGPPLIETLLARGKTPLIYDFDDAIYLPAAGSQYGALNWLRNPQKVGRICAGAAHVMVGNRYLAEHARQFNDAVSIVPSTIELDSYTLEAQRRANQVPIIGWSGSVSTTPYLDTIRGALQRLRRETEFKFRYIGPQDYEIEGVEVENVRWRSESEVADLRPLDIGLMPLPDEPWTRGKCAMKALQYLALGIATVASPVGVNSDIIRPGDNGFLAASEDEWVEKLRLLLNSPPLRQSVGAAGRRTVEAEFSAAAQAPCVREIFEQAIESRR